ncbi:hypothetical protein [Brachyspira pilosicoli]|nr:hypothetical protein [Brachyspira pilosicoli]
MKQVQESLKAIENGLKDTINTKSFINFKKYFIRYSCCTWRV